MKIDIIPILHDNYCYLITNGLNKACLVDIGEASPVIDFCNRHNLIVETVLITHHHDDHRAGLDSLLEMFPKAEVITPNLFQEKRKIDYLNSELISLKTPGHTLDHVCYCINSHLFTGDLLFHLGCGRVFEGDYQMMFNSLRKIIDFAPDTLIYPGHEYTYTNCEFFEKLFKNTALEERYRKIKEQLPINRPSIPTSVKEQIEINPFLGENRTCYLKALGLSENTSPFELFCLLRDEKNKV